jgi:hypothetical protein
VVPDVPKEAGMNVRKLRKLQKWILAEPRRYRQDWWGWTGNSLAIQEQNPPCGTVACLAGNTALMEGYKAPSQINGRFECMISPRGATVRIDRTAKRILGLTEDQRDRLFGIGPHSWPAKLWFEYRAAKTLEERAAVAVRRIDHFIKTKGRE